MSGVLERFLRYVKIDTQSQDEVEAFPSTEKQKDLLRLLEAELKDLGAADAGMDEHGYVYAAIPATDAAKYPKKVGFLAHVDTSDAVSGKDVHPRLIENYDGRDVVLNEELGYVLSAAQFPFLKDLAGQTLICTDGTTLLGADDKAGVAEIMAMAEYLLEHKEIPHGEIRIAFTPDEEVGRGVDFFDVKRFGADYAYTVDGGACGELEYECFNAAGVKVQITGTSIHPGSAKNQMINALTVGMELNALLPREETPECTEGYEGFYHLTGMQGTVDSAVMNYIIRDHDRSKFEAKKQYIAKAAAFLNEKYGKEVLQVEIKDSYYNMREIVEKSMFTVDNAVAAMKSLGMAGESVPIRGGTDGARLSYMGLPCPNLCTGGYNFHGRYECATVEGLELCTKLLIALATEYNR